MSPDSSLSLDRRLICFYGNRDTAVWEGALVCVCVCFHEHILLEAWWGVRKTLKWAAWRIKWGKGKPWTHLRGEMKDYLRWWGTGVLRGERGPLQLPCLSPPFRGCGSPDAGILASHRSSLPQACSSPHEVVWSGVAVGRPAALGERERRTGVCVDSARLLGWRVAQRRLWGAALEFLELRWRENRALYAKKRVGWVTLCR